MNPCVKFAGCRQERSIQDRWRGQAISPESQREQFKTRRLWGQNSVFVFDCSWMDDCLTVLVVECWVYSLCREVHLQCQIWEGLLVSSNFAPSLILLNQAFLQLVLVSQTLRWCLFEQGCHPFHLHYHHCDHLTLSWAAEKRVVPSSGPEQFKFASFMPVTLSCDHRVIDG